MNHLAIYSRKRNKDYIKLMLDGIKTLDIKWSFNKIAPFNKLNKDDHIYIKEASGPVVGRIKVTEVQNIEIFHPDQILDIFLNVIEEIGLDDEDHAKRVAKKMSGKRYATLFKFTNPEPLKFPIRIEKHDRRVWVANYNLPIDLKLAYGD